MTALAVMLSAFQTLHCWECWRFVRSRLRCALFRAKPGWPTLSRVAVLAPCKGADEDLERNLQALFDQDHGHYAIVFIVEREGDPAVPVIRRLIDRNRHVAAHVFVAGEAYDSGQKVHNLLETIERLSDHYEILAFTDADARHDEHWLRGLTAHLYRPRTGAATGYRWFVPRRNTLANLILYSINSAVAGMFGRGATTFIWGGSWAIRRDHFERIGLHEAWRGTLSDDLVARQAVRRAGLRIEFEPRCLAASEIDVSWSELFEFVRRQYLIGRRYTPGYWSMSLAAGTLMQAAFWGNLAAAVVGFAVGARGWWWAALASAAIYSLNAARGWLRQETGRRALPAYSRQLAVARRFDIFAGPLVGLFSWLAMLASAMGNTIAWRGNQYWIAPGGKIQLVARRPIAAPEGQETITCRIQLRAVPPVDDGNDDEDQQERRAA